MDTWSTPVCATNGTKEYPWVHICEQIELPWGSICTDPELDPNLPEPRIYRALVLGI